MLQCPIRHLTCLLRRSRSSTATVKCRSYRHLPRWALDKGHAIQNDQRRHASSVDASAQDVKHDTGRLFRNHVKYAKASHLLQPPPSARGNPAAWAALLEACLPEQLRSLHPQWPLASAHTRASESDVPALLHQAWEQSGVDMLVHIGLEQQRWDAMIWLANSILMQAKNPNEPTLHSVAFRKFKWPRRQNLQALTAEMSNMKEITLEDDKPWSQDLSLNELTNQARSTAHIASWPQLHGAVGHLWQTVGGLILAASNRSGDAANLIMSKALQIIAQMHHEGFVPDGVYKDLSQEVQADSRPTMITELSSVIMSHLTDAVSNNYHLGEGQVSELSQLPLLKSGQVNLQLGPELWLEFVLWCCLHGGWLADATATLSILRKFKGRESWHLICWQDFASSPRAAWSDLLHRRLQAQKGSQGSKRSEDSPQTQLHSIERTISTEVVAALVEALLSGIGSLPLKGYSIAWVQERVLMLKALLDRDKMSLGHASWDEVIVRFTELPELDLLGHPRLVESILELAQIYGRESGSLNAQPVGPTEASSNSYIFNGTASTLGIYHRVLDAYIQERNMEGALRVLALLQNLTDKNKHQALRDFFAILRSKNPNKTQDMESMSVSSTEQLQSRNGNAEFPGFFPAIPPVILAKLLDLVTESRSFELGRWLIHSTDVDGPLIAQDLYSDQVLAPSIIRFAAATGDTALLSSVTRVQDAAVSGQTLIALCESRIHNKDWKGASNVLHLMKEHSLHEWTPIDLVMLLRTLFRYIETPKDEISARGAAELLQKLLRGGFGQVWGSEYAHLDSIVGILSTIDETLTELCYDLLGNVHLSAVDLSIQDFNTLLEGAVKVYGSTNGQKLWKLWCEKRLSTRQVRAPRPDAITTYPVSPIAEQFSAGNIQKPSTSPPLAPTFTGYIKPDLSTLRIIVKQALTEIEVGDGLEADQSTRLYQRSNGAQSSESNAREVLKWAATRFHHVFHLRPIDIDAELHEQSPTPAPSDKPPSTPLDLYSPDTTKVYHSLVNSDPAWLSSSEQKMRHFAQQSGDRHVVFDPTSRIRRRFLHLLAADLGLVSESHGEDGDEGVVVLKTPKVPEVPSLTVGEWCDLKADREG